MSGEYDQTVGSIAYQLSEASPKQKTINLKMTLGYGRGLLKEMEAEKDENNRLRVALARVLFDFAPPGPGCGCDSDTGNCSWHQALDLVKDEYYSMFD